MKIAGRDYGIGALIALLVLVLAVIKAFGGLPGLSEIWLIAALALAVLL